MDGKQFRLGKKPGGGDGRRGHLKNAGFVLLLILFGWVIYSAVHSPANLTAVPFSQVISDVNAGKVKQIVVDGDKLQITPSDKNTATEISYKEAGSSIYEQGLPQGKVSLTNKPSSNGNSIWYGLVSGVLPVILIAFILIFMLRSAQGQGNQAMSFGKSKARLYGNEKEKVTFSDVAGSDESKQDLEEVVEFLKYPKKFEAVSARIPKGVLLVGPPGTGKTLLARAVAGEANAPFFSISGSEFV